MRSKKNTDLRSWLRIPCLALSALAVAACGGDDETEHSYETGIEPTSGGEGSGDDGPGVDEGEAVNIAYTLAEQEGHDVHAYSEVVVHQNDAGNWVIQLKRPRLHRFLEVVVDKSTGAGVLTVQTAGADS